MVVAQASTSPQGVRSFGSRGHLPCLHSKGFGDSYGSSGFGSWRDAFGPRSGAASADEGGNCRRGFRRSQGADEDRRSNAEQSCLLHGTTCRGGSVEEDWESSREEGTGFPRRSGWTEEDVGGGRKSCARPCCNRKGDEDARDCGRRSAAESTGFVRGGLARQVGPKGPGQVPGDLKKAPKFSSAYIKKGNKMVPRDVNYDYVKMYVQRIDRTVKRGRNKGIMSNSASDDKQLLNDFVYYLAQADQELRLRLDKATRTGQGECSCCRRRNNAKVPNFNSHTNNTCVEEEEEEW